MLTIAARTRVFLHREPVDFRKSHDGLSGIVRNALKEDPLSGDIYVFLNRRNDRVKLIQWDGNGLWMHYKRLEKGTFKMTAVRDGDDVRITRADLSMMLEGVEVKKGKFVRRFAETLRIDSRPSDDDRPRRPPE
jgi:transposase